MDLSSLTQVADRIPYLLKSADRALIQDWLKSAGPFEAASSCFMDATTLSSVLNLVSDHSAKLDPIALADLSTFVNAVLLNDRIFHVTTRGLDSLQLNEGLGNQPIVIAIPAPDDHRLRGVLAQIWSDARGYLNRIQSGRPPVWFEMQKCWVDLFGEEHSPYSVYDAHFLTETFTSESWVVRDLSDADPQEPERVKNQLEEVAYYVAVNSARGLYNILLSEVLALPYYACAARLPILNAISDQGTRVSYQAATVLDQAFRATTDDYFRATSANPFPFFVSALLNRTTTVKDVLPTLANLRKEAAVLRRHRAEIEQAAKDGNTKELARIKTAMTSRGKALALKWAIPMIATGTLAALPKVAVATVHEALIVATIAMLARTKWEDVDMVIRPILRPDLSFLTSVASDARMFLNTWQRATELWHNATSESSEFHFLRKWI